MRGIARSLRRARWLARSRLTALVRHPARTAIRGVVLVALAASAVSMAIPLYWLFSAAFRPPGTITFPPQFLPGRVTLANFAVVVEETSFVGVYLVNSLLVSVSTVVLTVGIATPAGYALSRYDFRYQTHLLVGLLVAQLVPIMGMIVPLYRMYSVLGLLDTRLVVVLTDTVLVVPIATWLIKGYFDTLPPKLEEAARVGGATRWQAFRIVAPLARPAIGAAALFAFVQSWNQFLIPLTFTSSRANWTIPVGLYGFISRRGVVDWGLLGAASLIAMLPVLVLFVVFQRQFIAGLSGGGLRGQ